MPFTSLSGIGWNALSDRVALRDPRGRSPWPSVEQDSSGRLLAKGKFNLLHEYRPLKDDAIRFLEVTRDSNPIHVQGEIVPGAFTLSKSLMILELLLEDYAPKRVKAKFTGASFYGERTVNHFFLRPGHDGSGVHTEVNTYQSGRLISKLEVHGSSSEKTVLGDLTKALPSQNMSLLREFCESLGVDPVAYGPSGPLGRHIFPRAFLASLPSGEMVRQLKGSGGMLNVLSLDFDRPALPLSAPSMPEVRIEQGRSGPKRFSRILTRIIDGLKTYGKGFALVHAPSKA